mgnify:CR=1 FL=1
MNRQAWVEYKPAAGVPWVPAKWHECDLAKSKEIFALNVTFVQYYDNGAWYYANGFGSVIDSNLHSFTHWRFQGIYGDIYGGGWF